MPRLVTDRQADLLYLWGAGMTAAEAARAVGITPASSYDHVVKAKIRLGPSTIDELCERCAADLAAAEERARRRSEPDG